MGSEMCIRDSAKGIILRTEVGTISRQGRYSQGVRVMGMKGKDDYVASLAIIQDGGDESEAPEENEGAPAEGTPPEREAVPTETPETADASTEEPAADADSESAE